MKRNERVIEGILMAVALTAVAVLGLLIIFIFKEGSPALAQIGVFDFITGHKWAPSRQVFGIWPMIVGSFWVTIGALVLSVPLGLACAIFLAEVAPQKVSQVLKPVLELLAGIPSVVYGFMGLVLLVPLIRNTLGGTGFSILAASLVLSIMVLPTMISISYDALRAVPAAYRDGMAALGATPWQVISMVVLPAAKSGVVAGVILAMGRAIGETMAVIMVAGNAAVVPNSPLQPVRTLTSNIALEMGYAAGLHRQALFATGVVLFVIIGFLNLVARRVVIGKVKRG